MGAATDSGFGSGSGRGSCCGCVEEGSSGFVASTCAAGSATGAGSTGSKENIVGTLGILYSAGDGTVYQNMAANFTAVSGYAFLAFNLLCAPCFAAMGAIKREMNNRKWFFVAVGYQCGFAYLIGLIVNNIGLLAQGVFSIWTVVAILVIIGMIYLLVRPYKESQTLKVGKTSVAASK